MTTPPLAPHRCAVPKCDEQIPAHLVMCMRHWKLVPSHIHGRILRHYNTGQERHPEQITPGYTAAVEAGVRAVLLATKQDATMRPHYPPGAAAPPASLGQPDGHAPRPDWGEQ